MLHRKRFKGIIISFLLFLGEGLHLLHAGLEPLADLAPHFIDIRFEMQPNGSESCVQTIFGITNFNNQVQQKGLPLVMHCYGGNTSQRGAVTPLFQQCAANNTERFRCASVDFESNKDILQYVIRLCLLLLLEQQQETKKNTELYNFMHVLTQNLVNALEKKSPLSPFFLLFKDGTLLLPGSVDASCSQKLQQSFIKHFAALEDSAKQEESGAAATPQKDAASSRSGETSLFDRFSSRVKNFFKRNADPALSPLDS